MTKNKRITIVLTDDLNKMLEKTKKEEFYNKTYCYMLRELLKFAILNYKCGKKK